MFQFKKGCKMQDSGIEVAFRDRQDRLPQEKA
jgi:hypothetical protein